MILDRTEYAADYAAQLPHLADALALIAQNPHPGPGRHPFAGGYLMEQSGTTRPAQDGTFEAHRQYIDVQILAEGQEWLVWNRLERLTDAAPYDPATDKSALSGEGSLVELTAGMFAVLFPADAHKACRHPAGAAPGPFAKYVVKLEL